MPSSTSLLQMPKVAMKKMLEQCDFESIQILRKTCHDLRNFVDDVKPESYIREMYINLEKDKISLTLYFDEDLKPIEQPIHIRYQSDENENENENGCKVVRDRIDTETDKILRNEDFVKIFCQDFKDIIKNQKLTIQYFQVVFVDYSNPVLEDYCKEFKRVLGSKRQSGPLKVKTIYLRMFDQSQIRSILPYIHSKSLKRIDIINGRRENDTTLEIDEIVKLDQWKSAEELEIHYFYVSNSSYFTHFSRGIVYFQVICLEDVLVLKRAFLQNPNFKKFTIRYNHLNNEPHLFSIGPLFIDSDPNGVIRRRCFSRVSNSESHVLSIQLESFHIRFDCIELEDLPWNAVIMS